MDGDYQDAENAITNELDIRARSLVSGYKQAAMADMFGGTVFEEKDVEDDGDDEEETDDDEGKKDSKKSDKPEEEDNERDK